MLLVICFSFLLSISDGLVDELMVYFLRQGAALASLAVESSNVLEMSLAPGLIPVDYGYMVLLFIICVVQLILYNT